MPHTACMGLPLSTIYFICIGKAQIVDLGPIEPSSSPIARERIAIDGFQLETGITCCFFPETGIVSAT